MPNSIRDEGALEGLQTLLAVAKSGVNFRDDLGQLLEEDPILFCFQIHDTGALTANDHVATMKPTERLSAFVAAMVARHNEFDPAGGGRIADVDRDHGGFIPR